MRNINPLCIYHGNCDDGFASAVIMKAKMPATELYAGKYQTPPPDVTDRDVFILDFSYKRPVLLEMSTKANTITILDHHKTAMEDLMDFPDAADNVTVHFDMSRSGAGMTWDHFFKAVPRPQFVNYIEDRDLWRKALPNGDEFTIALRSYPMDVDLWAKFLVNDVDDLIKEGHSIQRYYRLRIEEFKQSAFICDIAGNTAAVVNVPYFAASEVAGEIAERAEFGACYFYANGRFNYSLRSRGDFDVSAIAKKFGGGGHKNAAGFSTSMPVHVPLK